MSSREFIPTDIHPIPERDPSELQAVMAEIMDYRRRGTESFGAVVLHGAGAEHFSELQEILKEDSPVVTVAPRRGTQSLHHDEGGLSLNEVTGIYTTQGNVDLVVIPGRSLRYGPTRIYPRLHAGEEILNNQRVSTKLFRGRPSVPMFVLHEVLRAGDLVIFDGSQPHLTENATPDRESLICFVP